jgi:hypothetical protein
MSLSLRVFVILSLCLLAPLLLAGSPPLLDYPNHLARMKVAFEPDAFTQKFYRFEWIVVGNLGHEAVVWLLSHVMPVESASEIAVAIAVALPAVGIAWLSLILHGRITVPAIIGLTFVWSGVLQYGFISYSLGIGLAVCTFAYWIASEDRPLALRVAIGTVACLVMFFAHLLAFAFYGIALAGYMAGRLVWRQDRTPVARIGDAMVAGLQAVPTLVIMVWANRGGAASELEIAPLGEKLENFAFLMYRTWEPYMAAVLGVCLVLMLASALRHRSAFAVPMVGPIVALVLAYFVMPADISHGSSGAMNIDRRMLPFIAWLALAALRDPVPPNGQRLAIYGASAFVLVKLGTMVQQSWMPWVREEAALRTCLRAVEPGSSVVSLIFPVSDDAFEVAFRPPGIYHAGAWAVTDRSAFFPSLFAYRFQQPLSYTDAWLKTAEAFDAPLLIPGVDYDPQALTQFDYLIGLYPVPDRTVPKEIAAHMGPELCRTDYFGLFPITKTNLAAD